MKATDELQPTDVLDDQVKRDALVKRIQFGGDEVVQAKDGLGSATLSMAQGVSTFNTPTSHLESASLVEEHATVCNPAMPMQGLKLISTLSRCRVH